MSFINESNIDRIIRVILGVAMIALGWSKVIPGLAGTVVAIVGLLPLITGLVGFCPAYALIKIRTNR